MEYEIRTLCFSVSISPAVKIYKYYAGHAIACIGKDVPDDLVALSISWEEIV